MKKKTQTFFLGKYSLVVFFLCMVVGATAQPTLNWGTAIYEVAPASGGSWGQGVSFGDDIVMDSQANVISTGYSLGNFDFDPSPTHQALSQGDNSANIYIQKLDEEGHLLWYRYYSNQGTAFGKGITVDNDDNIYVVGHFSGTMNFGSGMSATSNGDSDIYVLKLDANGNTLWVRNFGLSDYDYGKDIFYNKDTDELYFTGSYDTSQYGSVSDDAFLYKIDPQTGNDIWFRTFGSYQSETSNSITGDDLGNIYMTGTYLKNLYYRDFTSGNAISTLLTAQNPYGSNVFVLKLSGSGNIVWSKGFNKVTTVKHKRVDSQEITIDGNRNIYIGGTFNGSVDFNPGTQNFVTQNQGNIDGYVVRLSQYGDFGWFQRVLGNSTGGWDRIEALTIDNQNGVLVGGVTSVGNMYVSRHAKANGNLDWVANIGNSGWVTGLVVGKCDQIVGTGWASNGVLDLDPDPNTQLNPAQVGHTNAFVFSWGSSIPPVLNPSFTFEVCQTTVKVTGVNQVAGANPNSDWHLVEYFPGTATEIVRESIYWWQQSAPYVYSNNTITFNYQLQPGKFYYIKHGLYFNNCAPWTEARKYGVVANNIPCFKNAISIKTPGKVLSDNETSSDNLKIYPNPTTSILNVDYGSDTSVSYDIVNLFGQIIRKGNLENNSIDVSSLENGTYILQLNTSAKLLVKSFIKR